MRKFREAFVASWARLKKDVREAIGVYKQQSAEIEFKKASNTRRPSPLTRMLLWGSIVINTIIAIALIPTIVLMPVSVLLLIIVIYTYQTFLRRG